MVAYAQNEYEAKHHIYYRLVQFILIVIAILVIVALMKFTEFKFMNIFTSLVAFIPTGWGMILIAQQAIFAVHHSLECCCFLGSFI